VWRGIPAILALVAFTVLSGCTTPPTRGTPLPEALGNEAIVPGISMARRWGDERPAGLDDWLKLSQQELEARYDAVMNRPHNYLVISGGGSDGAYGAGPLCGWTESGTRPQFQIVNRTVSSLIRSQGIGDLTSLYLLSEHNASFTAWPTCPTTLQCCHPNPLTRNTWRRCSKSVTTRGVRVIPGQNCQMYRPMKVSHNCCPF